MGDRRSVEEFEVVVEGVYIGDSFFESIKVVGKVEDFSMLVVLVCMVVRFFFIWFGS